MNSFLEAVLWIMMAGFFVLWGVFVARAFALFRLKRKLSGDPVDSPENSELVARATSRVLVVFFAAFGLMVLIVLLMFAQSTLEANSQ